MEQYELPDGWVWATLGEICEVNPGLSWPENVTEETAISFVSMAAVDDIDGQIVASEPRPIGEVWKGYTRFVEGDVIFARITPCMENGKAAIATNLVNGIGTGSTEFHVLRPTEAVLSEWVYHFVRQQSFRDEASRAMTGTAGQLRVPRVFMEEASIPLPPLPEQLRIAEKIEALFDQSRTAREALDAIPALLRQFRQAALAAAFRGELSTRDPDDEPAPVLLERILEERRRRWEADLRAKGKDPRRYTYPEPVPPDTSALPELPEGWVWTNIGQIADVIGGLTKNSKRQAHNLQLPYLRVANVYANELVLDDVQEIGVLKTELERVLLQEGDLLVVEGNGSIDQIGRVAVWDGSIDPCVHQNHIIKVRFDPVEISRYALFWLLSPQGRDLIINVASSTSGLYTLSLSKVSALPIPLAPISEQHRIVGRLESLLIQADVIEAAAESACRRLDQLDQSILARAFRGELVPQDPNDEPASVLLARIRAERERRAGERASRQKDKRRR